MSYYDNSLGDFDPGIDVPGPFLDWYSLGTKDGTVPAGSWGLRETGERAALFELNTFIFKWPTSRTGWKEDTKGAKGVSPRKQWNPNRAKFEKEPADGDWKKAFQVEVALAADQRALWEQNGFGAYVAFVDIMTLIRATAEAELPKLPLLAWTGKRQIRTGAGPTLVAVFALAGYVTCPPCLLGPQALEAPAAPPAIKSVPVWDTSRAVSVPASAVTGGSRRDQINEEVPIEAYTRDAGGGDLGDDIPFGPEVR